MKDPKTRLRKSKIERAMKWSTSKPRHPYKPEVPTKTIAAREDAGVLSHNFSLEDVLNKLPKDVLPCDVYLSCADSDLNIEYAVHRADDRFAEKEQRYQKQLAAYEKELIVYEADLKNWKKSIEEKVDKEMARELKDAIAIVKINGKKVIDVDDDH
jgi:hypothetical protein